MKIAIIGAGIGGMAAAFDLVKAGHVVTIFESTQAPGGLAAGFKEPEWDWSVEKFYHHWFSSDRHMLGLIDELGLRHKVIFLRPYTVVYWEGKFYPFDSIFSNIPLFILKRFALPDAIRYGLAGAYLRFSPWWKPLEQHTADAWTKKWFGERVHSVQWQPLLSSKFGDHYAKQVNMAWLWARLHSRTTRLGTFEGGFQAFSDLLADHLKSLGVSIHFNTYVNNLSSHLQGGILVNSSLGEEQFDQCLSTTSPALLAKMATALAPEYLKGLLDLKNMGAVVMILALKQQLSPEGYYWYNIPKASGFPFLSLVEHTNFVPSKHFNGDHIVYIGDYLETDHEHFSLSQDEILQRFLPYLPRFNPAFQPNWIRKTWLFRTNYAQPIPLINHSKNIPSLRTPLPGLFFASMSQVYPWDRGTNFAVEIGRRAARLMIEDSR
jgi:protoporphyrinogen oxidase